MYHKRLRRKIIRKLPWEHLAECWATSIRFSIEISALHSHTFSCALSTCPASTQHAIRWRNQPNETYTKIYIKTNHRAARPSAPCVFCIVLRRTQIYIKSHFEYALAPNKILLHSAWEQQIETRQIENKRNGRHAARFNFEKQHTRTTPVPSILTRKCVP